MNAELVSRVAGRRVVASVSGGKDSAALSLWLTEQGIDHDRVFMDTGWEHRKTYEYLRGELPRVIGPIVEIRSSELPSIDPLLIPASRPHLRAAVEAGNPMILLCLCKAMFPSRVKRFCTQELKVFPMQRCINARVEAGEDVVNAVGIRHAESRSRAKLGEWEWSDGFDCEVWRPLIHWTEQEVIDIHKRHGLAPNPMYLAGASRVGCWPCIYARKAEVRMLGEDDERVVLIEELEAELTEHAAARAALKGEALRWPRTWFQQGSGRALNQLWPIRKSIAWSRTSRGGKQIELFAPAASDAGCMRWGLCETHGRVAAGEVQSC